MTNSMAQRKAAGIYDQAVAKVGIRLFFAPPFPDSLFELFFRFYATRRHHRMLAKSLTRRSASGGSVSGEGENTLSRPDAFFPPGFRRRPALPSGPGLQPSDPILNRNLKRKVHLPDINF